MTQENNFLAPETVYITTLPLLSDAIMQQGCFTRVWVGSTIRPHPQTVP